MTLAQRFAEKFEPVPEAGCWLWIASTNARGYGQIQTGSRPELAHRVAWRLTNGEIPDGMHVCHRCDTPSCVNPSHLFLGTDLDNVQDMFRKGRESRHQRENGERHAMAAITDEVALQIFADGGRHIDIAKRFGVCKSTVSHIKTGRQWSAITGATFIQRERRNSP